MNAKKLYLILIGSIIGLGLISLVLLYVAGIIMQKSANQLISVKLDNLVLDEQEKAYLQARKDLEKYKDLAATIENVLPKSKDQARAVREIYKIGDESKITIDRINFSSSTLGQKASAGSTSTKSSTQTLSQAKAVDGMPGVLGVDMDMSLRSSKGSESYISYSDLLTFLQKIELNRRSMQIKKLNVEVDSLASGKDNISGVDLTVTIFVKP